ncbi:MAG: dTMP kinase [Pseudomonadota bacterium]|nr:dTMP kinase [Pseudomonadota bacterium]
MTGSKTSAMFVTLEGGEGAGKSTSRDYIVSLLEEYNVPFVQTREPGGTPIGEALRELLLSNEGTAPSVTTELLMVFAARAQHLYEIIEPALRDGKWVLCDRFTDATYAYQGYGRGFDLGEIEALESLVQRGRRPDITLLFDIDPKLGMARVMQRAELDRFEEEELEFFQRVREGYLSHAEFDSRLKIIDASRSIGDVQHALREILLPLLDGAL